MHASLAMNAGDIKLQLLNVFSWWNHRRLSLYPSGQELSGERIEKNGADTRCHSNHRPDRMNPAGRRKGHTDPVKRKSQGEILNGFSKASPADFVSVHKSAQALTDKNHVRGLDGDVRSRPNGDSHVGLHESWGVVNAVPNHRNAHPAALKLAHSGGFVLGQDLRVELLDALERLQGVSPDGRRRSPRRSCRSRPSQDGRAAACGGVHSSRGCGRPR